MRRIVCCFCMSGLLFGCASRPPSVDPPASPPEPPVITAGTAAGRVMRVNKPGRFAVINFPLTDMPAVGQRLYVYRNQLRVGELRVTGPQREDNTVADIIAGEAQTGDEVRPE